MINIKKTCEIDIDRLEEHIGGGSRLVSFQVLNNGNVAMIFKFPERNDDRIRYTVKIHNRLGIQRQCSFTAVESSMVNVMLYAGELYAFMKGKEADDISINRLDPATKENIVPLNRGVIRQSIGISADDFMIAYADGTVTRYVKGIANTVLGAGRSTCLSLDFNRKYMVYDGEKIVRFDDAINRTYSIQCGKIDGFILARSDRSIAVCTGGRLVEYVREGDCFVSGRELAEFDIDDCSMVKDTAAVLSGRTIYVYKTV
ncbi:MAG: hypothetical protein PUG51_03040 [Firmicutes bacterium]|nr:hypothetical protein [Bacillota bacterium]